MICVLSRDRSVISLKLDISLRSESETLLFPFPRTSVTDPVPLSVKTVIPRAFNFSFADDSSFRKFRKETYYEASKNLQLKRMQDSEKGTPNKKKNNV